MISGMRPDLPFRLRAWIQRLLVIVMLFVTGIAAAQPSYRLGPGDTLRITVYNHPDLTTEAQIAGSGRITFPLVGDVELGGLEKGEAETKIARLLLEGRYVPRPQVNILVIQFRSIQVSVLGQVNKPGKYPLETASSLTDVLALAGGIAQTGADVVTLISRGADGREARRVVDVNAMVQAGDMASNMPIANGDIVYVPRAPMFYIYGEVQRPGAFRLEKDMTVMQALSVGGGLTVRGTERGVRINRRDAAGKVQTMQAELSETLRENDVVYVRESLF